MSKKAPKKPVRTPKNPFEGNHADEEYIPAEIKARSMRKFTSGPNKGKSGEHFLVRWVGFAEEKDETWEPIEHLGKHTDLINEYEVWLKKHNEELDLQLKEQKATKRKAELEGREAAALKERERAPKKARKDADDNDDGEDEEDEEDEEDGEDDVSGETTIDKKQRRARKLNSKVWVSNAFLPKRDASNAVVSGKCLVKKECGAECGEKVATVNSSPSALWAHLKADHPAEYLALKMAQVTLLSYA
jgi:hypothetical protein